MPIGRRQKQYVSKDIGKSEPLHIVVREENQCSQYRKWYRVFKKTKNTTTE